MSSKTAFFLTFFSLIFISTLCFAQDKQMVVTVDDLPVVDYGVNDPEFRKTLTSQLIQIFQDYNIPAIGFVNESKLYNEKGQIDPDQKNLLELWLSSGYELGNHTYSHPSYHQTPFEAYTHDLLKGEKVTRDLSTKYELPFRYFRHPFLHIGNSASHADSLRTFLNNHGYTIAPVTIDNEDYIFARAYHIAWVQEDQELMDKIGAAYTDYMEDKLLFYEKSSQALFDRIMSHSLLLHANLLNAHYLDDLAEMYRKHGYTFISMEEALKDPAYQSEVTRYGPWGISWIDRWAISRKMGREFFEGDPLTPDFVKELAQ